MACKALRNPCPSTGLQGHYPCLPPSSLFPFCLKTFACAVFSAWKALSHPLLQPSLLFLWASVYLSHHAENSLTFPSPSVVSAVFSQHSTFQPLSFHGTYKLIAKILHTPKSMVFADLSKKQNGYNFDSFIPDIYCCVGCFHFFI